MFANILACHPYILFTFLMFLFPFLCESELPLDLSIRVYLSTIATILQQHWQFSSDSKHAIITFICFAFFDRLKLVPDSSVLSQTPSPPIGHIMRLFPLVLYTTIICKPPWTPLCTIVGCPWTHYCICLWLLGHIICLVQDPLGCIMWPDQTPLDTPLDALGGFWPLCTPNQLRAKQPTYNSWREGYLLPTWARKIPCQCFDWMLHLSSGWKSRSVNKCCYL